ncbi:MAG: GNAT family N-acetyltransferase [Candidatus Nitrosopelagicus sp.]|nr:GNAT family N-acetyltransferase [Candidatus Nitrosopelagicus sp.]
MKKKELDLSLKLVTVSDAQFLFDLLKERDKRTNISISHKKMPTYEEHTKFIKSKPYTKWYIVLKSKQKIGSVYLSKNDEVGVFISKKFQGEKIGDFALCELMKKNTRKRFLANLNPKNKKSIAFFSRNGFKLIQITFEKNN